MPINQQALMKNVRLYHGYVKQLECKGLRFRKQGKILCNDVIDKSMEFGIEKTSTEIGEYKVEQNV